MEVLKTFRHEYKFVISYEEMLKLRSKLDNLLTLDRGGSYLVRSLYFDSWDDIDYYDKLNGEIDRKKIRMRIYENNPDLIKIEIKAKYDYHQLKRSLIINRKQADSIINGDYSFLIDLDNEVAHDLYIMLNTGLYRPKVIIEYDRIAYLTSMNTRITIDYNIKRALDIENFFNGDINYLDLTDPKDYVLEVKFDRFLEPYVNDILSSSINRYQSVSKYMMGRNI